MNCTGGEMGSGGMVGDGMLYSGLGGDIDLREMLSCWEREYVDGLSSWERYRVKESL